MTNIETKIHPTELELARFLSNSLSLKEKKRVEEHIAICEECLQKVVSAYESVEMFEKDDRSGKGKDKIMKKINLYLLLAMVSFTLSFITPRYFLQLLVATLLLGIKWVVDSKSTRMLVMIHEAWKKGGGKEASRVLEQLEESSKKRF